MEIYKVLEIAYHRNGVGGNGFHVIRFVPTEDKKATMLGVVFHEPGNCAVFDIGLLQTTVAFGQNSWRGDTFEPELRARIKNRATPAG